MLQKTDSAFNMYRKQFTRPLIIATIFTWFSELALLIYFGIYLNSHGNLIYKIIWTLGFCGIGMGLTLGGLIDIFLIGRVSVRAGIWLTILFSMTTVGISCNLLCLHMNHHFQYFGGDNVSPYLFFLPGFIGSIVLGWLLGWLIFTEKGNHFLTKIKL